MITFEGQTPAGTIGPCEGAYGVSKVFYLDGVRLHVPDAVTDRHLRWLVDRPWLDQDGLIPADYVTQGMSIEDAYGQVNWYDELPDEGMRACCLDILRQKWLDENREWQYSGWGYTCAGYHKCLEQYVRALRETNKIGRIKIAEGLYCPSPAEEKCIKLRFANHSDVTRAYTECNATDILPLPRITALQEAMLINRQRQLNQSLYKMLTTVFNLYPAELPDEHHAPPMHSHAPTHDAAPGKGAVYLLAAGAAALLLLSR